MQIAKPDPHTASEFTQRLKAQCARSRQVYLVDSARLGDVIRPDDIRGKGTLNSSEWANELHPRPRGFNKIAKLCWGPRVCGGRVDIAAATRRKRDKKNHSGKGVNDVFP